MSTVCLLHPEQLAELVESTWAAMVGVPIAPGESSTDNDAEVLTACVQIAGAWRGTVLFEMSLEAAYRTTAAMLGTAEAELGTCDVQDTAAELCNIIAGGIKSLLPGPSTLSLPMVLHGSQFGIRIPSAREITQMSFQMEGKLLRIRLLEEYDRETESVN